MSLKEAEKYWADKLFKVWVVTLKPVSRTRKKEFETKYVRARTKAGAINTAIFHSFMRGPLTGKARLASANDLK